jgi:hypothetical protein
MTGIPSLLAFSRLGMTVGGWEGARSRAAGRFTIASSIMLICCSTSSSEGGPASRSSTPFFAAASFAPAATTFQYWLLRVLRTQATRSGFSCAKAGWARSAHAAADKRTAPDRFMGSPFDALHPCCVASSFPLAARPVLASAPARAHAAFMTLCLSTSTETATTITAPMAKIW